MLKKWMVILLGALLVLVAGCEKEKPAPVKKAVSQKITKRPSKPKAVSGSRKKNSSANAGNSSGKQVSPLIEATRRLTAAYNPKGRFDPFEPLFKEEKDTARPVVTRSKKKKRRTPQTPLERIALSQLKVSAIIRSPRGNRALVEDATGKGYVIRRGTYIGLNSGKVVAIMKDKIIVEEETENLLGEFMIQKRELKLQKPAGEF